jgi:predicted enzyme related to lactoylglutathione lyase
VFLNRVESAGGEVLKPKTVITKEIGYCADSMDTEGNIVSIHSRG